MTTRSRRVLIAAAIAGASLAALAAAAEAALPVWLRGTIERWASEALGRRVAIAGPFDLTLLPEPAVSAGQVTLANARWGADPDMVRLDRVTIRLDVLSLLSRPVRLREIAIVGARVALERDESGRGNWVFEAEGAGERPPAASPRLPVVVERASIRDFALTYRSRPESSPLRLGVHGLDARLDPATGMVELRADGTFNDAPWDVAGTLGTLERLYAAHDVEHALTGRIGGSTILARGRLREPLRLGGPDLEIDVQGPDVGAAAAAVGVRAPSTGPYHLEARLSTGPDGVDAVVTVGARGVAATARGRVSALLDPARLDATVQARGADASVVGGWIGVVGLPPRPFEIDGRLRRVDAGLALRAVKVRAGGTSLTVNGTVGPLPRCAGTDLSVRGAGTDLSELSALTRLRLPSGPFAVRGRFLRRPGTLAIDATEVRVHDAVVRASGTIGEPPRLDDLDLAFDAAGPDAAPFSGIARVDLPALPFDLRGRVARRGDALALDGVDLRLGGDALSVDGSLVPRRGMVGTDVRASLAGPDLAELAGRAGMKGAPPEPFAASGRIRVTPDGYELDGIEAGAGRLRAEVSGHLGKGPSLDGSALACRIEGPRLSDLAAWGIAAELPPDRFSIAGKLRIDAGTFRVEDAVADVARDRLGFDGALGPLPDLSGLDVVVHASGPSLAALSRFAPGHAAGLVERLAAEPYSLAGGLRRVPEGVELRDVAATIGNASVVAAGTLGTAGGLRGTDVRFEAKAADTSIPAAFAGVALPDGPFAALGRIERTGGGYRLDNVTASAGESRVRLSGTIGDPPDLLGTDLDVRVSGADLEEALGPPTGVSPLPTGSFELSGQIAGSRSEFSSKGFVARLGDNRLEGTLSVRLDGTPSVDAVLRAPRLDVAALLGAAAEEGPKEPGPKSPKRKARKDRGLLLPDRRLELEALRALDARLALTADEVLLPGVPLREVVVEGELRDGALRFDRIEGTGANGGRATAKLSLKPSGDGFALEAEGRLDGGRIDLSKTGESPNLAPSLDVEFQLEGAGASPHAIAAGADGRVLVVVGPGRIPNNLGDFVTSGLARGLLDALNPFRKSSPHTAVECGIAAAGIENGKLAVDPIAARTDKMTVVGKGKIDLRTEALDLVWTIKPRRGVGITAGSIANPYIKLGGTLASPSIEAKPFEAAASTGAAVATAGLTLLFRGLYDRITAERKVCVDALEKAERREEERKARKGS